jgi:hypothetical protein
MQQGHRLAPHGIANGAEWTPRSLPPAILPDHLWRALGGMLIVRGRAAACRLFLLGRPMFKGSLFNLAIPWWELILRGAIVYIFLLILLRISGKRQVGQLAPFDLVLLLVLSNAVQNSMNGGDNSLVGGLLSATVLVALNFTVGWLTFRSKRLAAVIEGRPQILIHNGKLFEDVMARSQLTHHELHAALRQSGCACVQEVATAVLENNGTISVVMRKNGGSHG